MSVPIDTRMNLPVPDFRLPSSRGETIRLNDYRHRASVVLIFVPDADDPASRERLREFAAHYDAYRTWKAEPLAVIAGPVEEAAALAAGLALPFPVLADPEGKVWAQMVGGQQGARPATIVLDRYNAMQKAEVADTYADLMSAREALEWVQYAEMACPECGVSEWPVEG